MSFQINGSAVRRKDTCQSIEGCGFAASVLADDSQNLTLTDIKGDSFYCNKTINGAAFKMKQAFFDRCFFQILITVTRSVTSMACCSSISYHLYITVFVFVDFADTKNTDHKSDQEPCQKKLTVRSLSINNAFSH